MPSPVPSTALNSLIGSRRAQAAGTELLTEELVGGDLTMAERGLPPLFTPNFYRNPYPVHWDEEHQLWVLTQGTGFPWTMVATGAKQFEAVAAVRPVRA